MNNFGITQFKPEQTHEVQILLKQIFIEFGFRFDLASKDKDLADIQASYFHDRGCFWVLSVDKQIAGTIALKQFDGNIYELKRFFIDPKFRGQGYGNQALGYVIKYAREKGIKTLRLDVDDILDAAQHLYQKYGFKKIEPYQESEIKTLRYFELSLLS